MYQEGHLPDVFTHKFVNPDLKQHHHVRADRELKLDCLVWENFLENQEAVCRPFMDFSEHLVVDKIDFFTDVVKSDKLSYGCVFGNS